VSPSESRAGRRERVIETILDRALQIMAEVGVGGLTMTMLARAMNIQPPSLYKYFPSVLAVHDALFHRGQQANLEVLEGGMAGCRPGLPALLAGLTATARWAVANPVLAQLLFWRPVPGFTPSEAAFAPAGQIVARLRQELGRAVDRNDLGPAARTDEALAVLASMHFGVLSQHLANQPGRDWSSSVYTQAYARVLDVFVAGYAPAPD
jgi:AcrR family transcriptional regulator